MTSDSMDSASFLREKARSLGFIAVGFTRPSCLPYFDSFLSWVSERRYGGMDWVTRYVNLRQDPGMLLAGCKTIITLAYPYSPDIPTSPDGLMAARYTQGLGEDYHVRVKRLGKQLARVVSELFPGSKSRVCVDSAPLLERSLAYASGIGFFGKNNMLIIPGYGSYLYLAEVLTTAAILHHEPKPMDSQCGSCTKCLEACPTKALEAPYVHNSSKCLSYFTIEHRGPLSHDVAKVMGKRFFGCDICQEVCPFNRKRGKAVISLLSAEEILQMGEKEFHQVFGKTAFARAGLSKLKESVRIALLK